MARKAKAAKTRPKAAKKRAVAKGRPKPKARSTKASKAKRSTSPKLKRPVRKKAPAKAVKPVRRTQARSRQKPATSGGTTASAILAGVNSPARPPQQKDVPRKWIKHYRSLMQLRDALLEQSGRLAKDVHEEAIGHSMHMADAGTDSFDRDFALSLLSADQNALAEIEAAVQRIHSGQYGICEMTGKPIGLARLEAIPWTRFSIEAQQQIEKSGWGNRVHLGSLRTVHGGETPEPDEPDEGEEKPAKA